MPMPWINSIDYIPQTKDNVFIFELLHTENVLSHLVILGGVFLNFQVLEVFLLPLRWFHYGKKIWPIQSLLLLFIDVYSMI